MAFLCCGHPSFMPIVHGGRAQTPPPIVLQRNPVLPHTPPSPGLNSFRSPHALELQIRRRLAIVFSSNTDSSGGNSSKEKSVGTGTGTSDASQGPPLLTILAGFIVFLLVLWTIGSFIMWLIGIIVG